MTMLHLRIPRVLFRIYVVANLVAAIAVAPIAFSFVPILVLLWYIFQWRRRMPALVGLMSELFAFIAIALFLSKPIGVYWSTLVAMPILILINAKLKEFTVERPPPDHIIEVGKRRLTNIGIAFGLILATLLLVAFLVGSLSLAVASLVLLLAFVGLATVAWRKSSLRPVVEVPLNRRMVAGSQTSFIIEFDVRARTGGRLFLKPRQDWVRLNPSVMAATGKTLTTSVTLSPSLSGPTTVKLDARAIDRWGLVETAMELEPVRLDIIPRAKYASWLVQKYIAGSRSGVLPLFANVGIIKPLHGWRRGTEYYGSRLYQPGDSLKNIDWKHTLQHGEITEKEFAEFGGRPAVLLVNVVARDAEEADKLAYSVVTTALSLARENIPAGWAAYSYDEVKLTTAPLGPEKLLSSSLQVIKELITVVEPKKYLVPPDVARLRGNIMRLGSVNSSAAVVLNALLKKEYEVLRRISSQSAVSTALEQVMRKVDKESNIIIISSPGNDADVLEFVKYNLSRKGNRVITLDT
jgi:uncharacterized protein (DUF58 family)